MQEIKKTFQQPFDYQLSTMATIVLIKEAVLAQKERTGSSVISINKWIESEKKVSPINQGMSDH
jgi:hypothetical protein